MRLWWIVVSILPAIVASFRFAKWLFGATGLIRIVHVMSSSATVSCGFVASKTVSRLWEFQNFRPLMHNEDYSLCIRHVRFCIPICLYSNIDATKPQQGISVVNKKIRVFVALSTGILRRNTRTIRDSKFLLLFYMFCLT
jgi:hypothetical protein